SLPGDGGQINITPGGSLTANLTLDPQALQFAPLGDGAGGSISLTAAKSLSTGVLSIIGNLDASAAGSTASPGGNITLTSTLGTIFVQGNITANSAVGGTAGVGGSITISQGKATAFTIDPTLPACCGIKGTVQANGAAGGSISISADKAKTFTLASGADLTVAAATGSGGSITLSDKAGTLTIKGGPLSADAVSGSGG